MKPENRNKSVAIFSLPRSGSTFLQSELVARSSYQPLNEILRKAFRKNHDSPFFASKYISEENFNRLLANESPRDQVFLKNTFSALEWWGYVLKETDSIFQIEAIKKQFSNVTYIGLTRSFLWVLNAHLKINDVRKRRKYQSRSDRLRQSLKESKETQFDKYNEIYERGDQQHLWAFGFPWFWKLVAHLGVQGLELNNLTEKWVLKEVRYEDIAFNWGNNEILDLIFRSCWLPSDGSKRSMAHAGHQKHAHSTKRFKNNMYERIGNFDNEALYMVEDVLWDKFNELVPKRLLFIREAIIELTENFRKNLWSVVDEKPHIFIPDEVPQEKMVTVFLDEKQKNLWIANIPVTNTKFCEFLNFCIENWIQTPHVHLYSDITSKEVYYHDWRYYCNEKSANCPFVNGSAISAALYALYTWKKMASSDLYALVHKFVNDNLSIWNVSEFMPSTNISWTFPSRKFVYDLYWNVKELCVDISTWKSMTYGGSYKTEAFAATEWIIREIPATARDEDIGFRLFNDPDSTDINPDACSKEVLGYLVKLRDAKSPKELDVLHKEILKKATLHY